MKVEVIHIPVKTLKVRVLTAKYTRSFLKVLTKAIGHSSNDSIIVVDFTGIDLISYKLCADVAEVLIRSRIDGHRILQGKSLILKNLNEECKETVAATMKLRNDAVLTYDKGPEILGHFPAFLQQTFDFVCAHEPVSANQVAEQLKLKIGVAAERLRRLTEWGFVVRQMRPSTRKAIYEYRPVDPDTNK
jgi:hypothetical protein